MSRSLGESPIPQSVDPNTGETPNPAAILEDFAAKYQDLVFVQPGRKGPIRAGASPGAADQKLRSPAAEAVKYLLESLHWSGRELATWSGIPQPQLTAWLSGKSECLGADEIARIAWALAAALDSLLRSDQLTPPSGSLKQQLRVGRSKLDFLLNVLLALAGYSSGLRYEDVVWRRCFETSGEREPLCVGWFPWEPLVPDKRDFSGFAQEVTDYVCKLLGHPDWVPKRVNFQDAERQLRARAIDMMAPFLMIFPGRYTSYSFSKRIPLINIQLCAVVPRAHLQTVLSERRERSGSAPITGDLREDKIQLVLPPGEVSTALADIVFSNRCERASESFAKNLETSGRFGHGYELVKKVASQPLSSTGLVRVVLTSRPVGEWVLKELANAVAIVLPRRLLEFKFQVGFGLPPNEPRFLEALNKAIEVLEGAGTFDALYGRHRSPLKKGGVLVAKGPGRRTQYSRTARKDSGAVISGGLHQ